MKIKQRGVKNELLNTNPDSLLKKDENNSGLRSNSNRHHRMQTHQLKHEQSTKCLIITSQRQQCSDIAQITQKMTKYLTNIHDIQIDFVMPGIVLFYFYFYFFAGLLFASIKLISN